MNPKALPADKLLSTRAGYVKLGDLLNRKLTAIPLYTRYGKPRHNGAQSVARAVLPVDVCRDDDLTQVEFSLPRPTPTVQAAALWNAQYHGRYAAFASACPTCGKHTLLIIHQEQTGPECIWLTYHCYGCGDEWIDPFD